MTVSYSQISPSPLPDPIKFFSHTLEFQPHSPYSSKAPMEAIPLFVLAFVFFRWTQTTLGPQKSPPTPKSPPEKELLVALGKLLETKP